MSERIQCNNPVVLNSTNLFVECRPKFAKGFRHLADCGLCPKKISSNLLRSTESRGEAIARQIITGNKGTF